MNRSKPPTEINPRYALGRLILAAVGNHEKLPVVAERLRYAHPEDALRNLLSAIQGEGYPSRVVRLLPEVLCVPTNVVEEAIRATTIELWTEFRIVQEQRRSALASQPYRCDVLSEVIHHFGVHHPIRESLRNDLAAHIRQAREIAGRTGHEVVFLLYPRERNELVFAMPDGSGIVRSSLIPPSPHALAAAHLFGLSVDQIRVGWSPELGRAQTLQASLTAVLSDFKGRSQLDEDRL